MSPNAENADTSGPAGPQAIVYSPRPELRTAVTEALAAAQLAAPELPATREACIELLVTRPAAFLIVDWQWGSEEVNQVLAAIRGHFRVETRPVLMVIDELQMNVVATAAEYGVSQVHAGVIAVETLTACLNALVHEDKATQTIREALIGVAAAREKGDWSIATPMLQELWNQHPGNDRVAVELAENLIYEQQWEQAVALLKPFAETEPPLVRALHLLGRCALRQGDSEGAIKLLERAKIINPHNVERLIDLGQAFLGNDQVDAAMDQFGAALELDESSKDAKVGQGQCHLLKGDVNEALALLKAISGPRELASIFNTAAVLAMRHGRHEQGMQLYRSAMQAVGRDDKISARLFFNMGLGYKRWQKPDKALACFEKSLELDPAYVKAAEQKEAVQGGGKAKIATVHEEKIGSRDIAPASRGTVPPAHEEDGEDGENFAEDTFARDE